jgi:cationic peptide transport system permease protein
MITTLIRYFNLTFLTLLILVMLSFGLAYFFPGDPITNLMGTNTLDSQPLLMLTSQQTNIFMQLWYYVQALLAGEWGVSFATGKPLYQDIMRLLPATLELSIYAVTIALILGIPLGFLAGMNYHKKIDNIFMSSSMIMYSFPVFWLALLLILLISLQAQWLPMSGRLSLLFNVPHYSGFILVDILVSDIENKRFAFNNALQHLILPTLSVSFIAFAVFLRTTRRSVADVLETQYIKSAQTRGLPAKTIFFRHVLRNALLPVLPILAVQISTLVTNVMIVETIFSWPGIGDWLIQAIYERDYPAIRTGMLLVSVVVVIITMSLECISQLIDPTRDRFAYARR